MTTQTTIFIVKHARESSLVSYPTAKGMTPRSNLGDDNQDVLASRTLVHAGASL